MNTTITMAAAVVAAGCGALTAPAFAAAAVRPHISAAAASAAPSAPAAVVPVPPRPAPASRASPASATDPMAIVRTFKLEDLRAALAEAEAQSPPDTVAATCYAALIPIVQSSLASQLPAGSGPFLAFQKARGAVAMLAKLQSPDGPLSQINVACAPLVLDAQGTMIQLGVILGGTAATTGSVAVQPRSPRRWRRHKRPKS